ncbi:MAG: GAP family protein [Propionibacteriaceae bacterium]
MAGLSSALGEILPAAFGIAVSPLPIIASVLMLLSKQARRTAPAFAIGWLVGLTVVTVVVLLLAGSSDSTSNSDSTVSYWVKLVLGLVFLALAVNSWRGRPRPGQEKPPPKWMAGLDSVKPGVALGLGALLSALNPKNLALAVSGSVAIAQADLDTAGTIVCVAVFVIIGSLLVVGPVVAFFVAGQAMSKPLNELKTFMQDHNAAIMTVLLLLLGLSDVGKGLGGLIG